jgi:hypothetical protein
VHITTESLNLLMFRLLENVSRFPRSSLIRKRLNTSQCAVFRGVSGVPGVQGIFKSSSVQAIRDS